MNKFLKVIDDVIIAIIGKSVVEKRNHESVSTRKE